MDWNAEGQARSRSSASKQIALQLLKECQHVLAIPDASDVMRQVASTSTPQDTPDNFLQDASAASSRISAALTCVPGVNRTKTIKDEEERINQTAKVKQREDRGILPVKRKKFVEDHHNDCGADLSGSGIDPNCSADSGLGALAYHFTNQKGCCFWNRSAGSRRVF